jgi:ATP-dependent Clp protease ATP-binding subunit ClpA
MVMCSRCKKRPAIIFLTRSDDENNTSSEGLCINCAKELGIKPIDNILKQFNITDDNLDEINEQLADMANGEIPEEFQDFMGQAPAFPFMNNIFGDMSGNQENMDSDDAITADKKKKKGKKDKNQKQNEKKRRCLNAFCTNLTEKAKNGEIDRIIGRDKELYRVIQILSRRQKNNPCLIGEPGVGKTAIAEGLALKIVKKETPVRLQDKEVFMLDLTALLAGTQFRGQFEKRIKDLIEEIKESKNIILFIDEVHNLVGAGDNTEGSMNAANILKPALSRGEIQVIGATTFTEYRKYIEKDAALERRFQPVTVEEPSIADTVEILKGIKEYYENHHNVVISDEIIVLATRLSERYITDRFLPDKAIDLLDEASACASLRNKNIDKYVILKKELSDLKAEEEELSDETATDEPVDYEKIANIKTQILSKEKEFDDLKEHLDNGVTEDDIAKVIELWTGIPASKIKESDLKKLADLEKHIKEKIIGQDEAVNLVSAAIRRSRVQISPRRRPASFIFIGSTGVGKTELVKVLSKELFDTPETLIRLDMSEFMEKHSVSRIVGAPPGYVGYDEAGQLTEKVRRKPYSVILFDEIEKAHPDVMNILLQILDEGRITDAQGRTVNFENTVIVMTSNAGSDKKVGAMGFGKTDDETSKDRAIKALSEFLRPEFISRVDEVVFFSSLTVDDYKKISKLMLDEVKESLKEKDIDLSYTDKVLAFIAKNAHGGKRGARDLRNYIRRNVEDKIASIIVENCDKIVKSISVDIKDEKIDLQYK